MHEGCLWPARQLPQQTSGDRHRSVHLYGQMAEMDAILELADRFGLIVVKTPARRTAHSISPTSGIAG